MRALISVSDRTGITRFARGIVMTGLGWEIVSTGGTAKVLRETGIPVREVSDVTGFPECLDGRLKTLHPKMLGGILAKNTPGHEAELTELGIERVDMVVVNLYPFKETVAKSGVTVGEAIEQIDIGGPTMLRAAAKNYDRVIVVVDPDDYDVVLSALFSGHLFPTGLRMRLAAKVFAHTAAYDAAIRDYFEKALC